jgi:hypothetical protein
MTASGMGHFPTEFWSSLESKAGCDDVSRCFGLKLHAVGCMKGESVLTHWKYATFVDMFKARDDVGDGQCFCAIPVQETVLRW